MQRMKIVSKVEGRNIQTFQEGEPDGGVALSIEQFGAGKTTATFRVGGKKRIELNGTQLQIMFATMMAHFKERPKNPILSFDTLYSHDKRIVVERTITKKTKLAAAAGAYKPAGKVSKGKAVLANAVPKKAEKAPSKASKAATKKERVTKRFNALYE
jgi:hypothetical protein